MFSSSWRPKVSLKGSVKGFVSACLLGGLFFMLDWQQAFALLAGADLSFAVLFLLAFCFIVVLSALKWRILLSVLDINIGMFESVQFYWTGMFLSNFFPSNFGGDAARIYLLRGRGRLSSITASVFIERATGFFVLLVLVVGALWTRPDYFAIGGAQIALGALALGGLGVFAALPLFGRRVVAFLRAVAFGKNRFVDKGIEGFDRFWEVCAVYRGHFRPVFLCFLISLLFYLFRMVMQYLLVLGLGFDLGFWEVCFIAPVLDFVWSLPFTINGLGLVEGAFVLFYSQIGLVPECALAVAFLSRFLHLLGSSVGGIFLLKNRWS